MRKLSELLGIRPGITCVIGSGGKTTLIARLARELTAQGSVIVTTSTHILPFADMPTAHSLSQLQAMVNRGQPVCCGLPAENGKLTALPVEMEALAALADYVLVEADGSRHLPMKAHLPHEPVLPEGRRLTICVVGASGFGDKIGESAHRPEVFARLCGCDVEQIITPQRVAAVINRENLCDLVFVNQTHSVEEYQLAFQLARELRVPTCAGSLQKEIYQCLC